MDEMICVFKKCFANTLKMFGFFNFIPFFYRKISIDQYNDFYHATICSHTDESINNNKLFESLDSEVEKIQPALKTKTTPEELDEMINRVSMYFINVLEKFSLEMFSIYNQPSLLAKYLFKDMTRKNFYRNIKLKKLQAKYEKTNNKNKYIELMISYLQKVDPISIYQEHIFKKIMDPVLFKKYSDEIKNISVLVDNMTNLFNDMPCDVSILINYEILQNLYFNDFITVIKMKQKNKNKESPPAED